MKLHELIKYSRKKKNLTLLQLAKRANISYGMLYRLEDGAITRPHPDLLKKVASPLEIEYESLLKKSGYIQVSKNIKNEIEFVSVPLISLADYNGKTISKSAPTIRMPKPSQPYHAAISFDSNALTPLFNEGDIIFVSKRKVLEENGLYMVKSQNKWDVVIAKPIQKNLSCFYLPQLFLEYKGIEQESSYMKIVYTASPGAISREHATIQS